MKASAITAVLVGVLLSAGLPVVAKGQHGEGGGGGTPIMGRLRTIGFEWNTQSISAAGTGNFDGLGNSNALGAGIFCQSTVVRSGNYALEADGPNSRGSFCEIATKVAERPAVGATTFVRAYFRFTAFPTSDTNIFTLGPSNNTMVSAALTTTGQLQMKVQTTGNVGSPSAVLSTDTWYRVELSFTSSSTAGTQAAEMRIDGVTVASGSNLTIIANVAVAGSCVGWFTDPGNAVSLFVDDFAMNTSEGATTQTSWPGEGRAVLLRPISDNARGGWTAGAGGTTNLFAAVDNTPPTGTAVGTETDTTQIKNVVSSATDNCDLNLTSYESAGINNVDTITLVQAIISDAEGIATGTKAGALQVVSNPAQSVEDSFTFGEDIGAATGPWPGSPSTWAGHWGTAQVGDIAAANRATSPVFRVGKRTATTREVDVAAMGIYVEYISGPYVGALSQTKNAVKAGQVYRQ